MEEADCFKMRTSSGEGGEFKRRTSRGGGGKEVEETDSFKMRRK